MKAVRSSGAALGGAKIRNSEFGIQNRRAFTLIELLVVITILGILAALTVPALKNLGKSNIAASASRQLLDDVGRARQLAIGHHTTVYMVFVTTNFWTAMSNTNIPQFPLLVNLVEKQLTGYTFVSHGQLGDQPGDHSWQYLSDWQSLPDNSFIASWKFLPRNTFTSVNGTFNVAGFNSTNIFPFPTATNNTGVLTLPYIAFNYLGQLTINGVDPSYQDEYIPLAQGSVGYGYAGATKTPQMTVVGAADIQENPAGNSTSISYNIVHIDPLTGRATLEFYRIP